jgi:hypothetical protein
MRLSAAYKGVNALLMKEGAQDFRSLPRSIDETAAFVCELLKKQTEREAAAA